jgi:hypothetical protein
VTEKISLKLLWRCLLKPSSPQVWFCFLHFVLHEELWWRFQHSDNTGIFYLFLQHHFVLLKYSSYIIINYLSSSSYKNSSTACCMSC